MTWLWHKIDKAFFSEQDAFNLGVFRFLYCLALAYTYGCRYFKGYDDLIYGNAIEYYSFSLFGFTAYEILKILLISLLLLSAVGLKTRWVLIATTITHLVFEYPIGNGFKPYTTNIVFYVLMIISLAPGIDSFSIDNLIRRKFKRPIPPCLTYSWSYNLIKLTLGMVYLSAGVSKVVNSGFSWALDGNMQAYVLRRYLFTENANAIFMLNLPSGVLTSMAIITQIAEISFWTVVFFPRLGWAYALLGLSMHLGIFLIFKLNFLMMFCFAYLIFVNWKWLFSKLKIMPRSFLATK